MSSKKKGWGSFYFCDDVFSSEICIVSVLTMTYYSQINGNINMSSKKKGWGVFISMMMYSVARSAVKDLIIYNDFLLSNKAKH